MGPGGNPIGYEIHPGNTYEGHTMIPIIEKLQQRFGFPKPIVVADAGLLSKENIRDLEDRGLKRLEKRFRTDKLTKDKLNNRGYNRFLVMTGDASIRIDYDKVARDERLDGYKGYTTNSSLPDDRIIEEYGYLFMIERAFRFCKTDLDIRPMYHRLFNRIEAHV